jgi:hypothetical protein
MALLNQWIDSKLADIAKKLPTLVHQDAASFACGYNTGYKAALLDLQHNLDSLMDNIKEYPIYFSQIYQTFLDDNKEI